MGALCENACEGFRRPSQVLEEGGEAELGWSWLGWYWGFLESGPSKLASDREENGADDQGTEQNAKGSWYGVLQHLGAFGAEVGAEGGAVGLNCLGKLLLVISKRSGGDRGERTGVAASEQGLQVGVGGAARHGPLKGGGVFFTLQDAGTDLPVT